MYLKFLTTILFEQITTKNIMLKIKTYKILNSLISNIYYKLNHKYVIL